VCSSDVTPQDLDNGYDIYCCIPEHKLDQWKELLNMTINQFLKAFERRSIVNDKPLLVLLDEFPRLGKIEAITNGLATLRGKKVQIALFVQSKSQLNAIYGKDIAEVIADNCNYKAILKASEPATQEWCSKLVGTYDKKKLSSNVNSDMVGIGKGTGVSKTTEEKRIIKPEEFAYLQDIVCLFPTGYRRIEKTPYFKDAAFAAK
jgi:type IV secretion system protein VirD4